MKLTYREGDVFGVPIGAEGYCLGVVARVGKRSGIVLGYFFGRLFRTLPSEADAASLQPQGATLVVRFGDFHLMDGRWPIVSRVPGWDREMWPMPKFVRIEPGSNRVYLVSYSDTDPGERIKEQRINDNSSNYERDSMRGAGAMEITLSKLSGSIR